MPHPLEQKMTQLGRRWRLLLLLHGLGWLSVCLLLTVVGLGLADYLIRFQDRGVRTICTLVAVAVAAWASYRFLWPALTASATPVRLAQRVERRFPGLADRLASTMYFLSQPEDAPDAGSATLRRAIVHQTTAETAELDLNEALDIRPTRRALIAAGLAGGLALCLILLAPHSAQLALVRLARPWSADAWPQQNHLAFRTPVRRIASGQNFEVEVIDREGARLPEPVWIEFRRTAFDGAKVEERQRAAALNDALFGRQENVTRGFEYRAVGGDDYSMPWIAVEVLEPPAVDSLAVELHYPAYTGWPTQAGDKQLRALVGTRVGLNATVSKPLRAARLCRDGAEPVSLAINADRHGFQLSPAAEPGFVVEQTGSYWFELEDDDGLTGGADLKYEVRAVLDAPPTVMIELPANDLHVTPQASIPLKVSAKDDLAVAVISRLVDRSDRSDQEHERTELYRGPVPIQPQRAESTAGTEAGDLRVVEQRWDLEPLGLAPGTQLTLRAAAADYRPAEVVSPPRRITIITRDELEERLSERQAFLATEVARMLKLEQESRGQVTALEIQLREVGQLAASDLDRLQNAEMTQRQISRSLTGKGEGLGAQVAGVLAELENNRVDHPDIATRMKTLADDLERLGAESLPAIERELTAARKQSQAAADGGDSKSAAAQSQEVASSLGVAGGEQDQVISTLERQLAELSQWDSYRQFHRDLGQLRRDQQRVSDETAEVGRETLTKELSALSPQQRADLQKLGDEQQSLGRQFEKVEQQMQQAAARLAASDPAAAETLADAVREARRGNLAREMGETGKNLGSNQIGQAVARQKEVLEQLGEMLDILANRQESSLARLVEKLRGAENELGEMRKQQAGLRQRMEAAAGEADPAQRRRELERLAKEEESLAEQAQSLARRLERLQAQAASRRTGSAAGSLGKAGQAGSQGDGQQASDSARQAEQDLEQAQAEVAKSRRQAEMDLAFEQFVKMQDALAGLRSRQQEVVNEAERLGGIRQSEGRLTRGQAESVDQLGREQRLVGAETVGMSDKLAAAEAFSLALRRAADEMSRAAELFDDQQNLATAQSAARRALRRLELLLAALEPDAPAAGKQPDEGEAGGSAAGGEGGSQSPPSDGIAEIAQLKLIKLMQLEVNSRTQELDQSQSGSKPTPERQREYDLLSEEQGQLADLIRNLTPVVEREIESDPQRLPDLRESPTDDSLDEDGPALPPADPPSPGPRKDPQP